jgi:hypothetical protein
MNSRERVLAAVRREKPDKIPRDLSWGLSPAAYELFKAKTGAASLETTALISARRRL